MQAVIAQNGKPVIVDLPTPSPKSDELLVRVKATALNRADLLQVQGNYPPPAGSPETLGLEFAGEVVELGAEVTRFHIGDRVMALVGGGGYAEFAVVPESHTMPVPDNLSDEEAAAIPEAFITAYSNMIGLGRLKASETVLIHAGASGVGLAAIQIAKLYNATVIVTASAAKHDLCKALGADQTIDYKTENFAEAILAQHRGVDVVIEHIGAPYWNDNVRVLNKWGRIVFIGLMGGATAEVNFSQIMRKRLTVTGSTLRDREYHEKSQLVANFWAWAAPHFEQGNLKPIIWKTVSLSEVAQAHQLMEQNQNAGKIVLRIEA